MDEKSTAYVLLAMYQSLVAAIGVAAGRPIYQVSNRLLRSMMDEDTPQQAFDLLAIMSRDEPPKRGENNDD